jgi:ATP/ADP translocase/HEAT repeat protein
MSREHRDRLLETLFQIRPGEGRLALLLFLQNLCVVGAFIVGRSVRDALFLAHASKAQLPLMYVASAIAVAFVGVLYARVADRARRDRLTAALAIGFALLFCAARLLSGRTGDWIFGALYVLVEVCGALTIIQYWTLANDLFNPRDAKRLFGTIGAGGTVANIVLGGAVGFLARRVGAENLLWLCALLLVGHAVSALRLGQTTGVRSAPLRLRGARAGRPGAARVLESPHLRLVAALSAVTFLATTLVDFQFKTLAAAHFDQNALAAFFGHFYAVTGLLALGIQFFGSARFLSRFGVVAALGILPFFLGVGSAAGLVFPTLLAATFTKGSEFVFRYTINDATTQLLYLPVPAHIRAGAKAFIDGVVKPAAIALTGLTLIGTRALALSTTWAVAAASALLCGIWGVVVFRLRAHYVRSLQDTLRRRSLDLDGSRAHVVDGSTSRVLLLALASDDPKEVLNALELLPHAAVADAGTPVVRLLSSPAPQVRAAALAHLGRTGSLQFGNAAFRLFEDPDPGVRAAAIDAFCAIGRDKAVRNVKAFLKDPQGPIRAAAIASMIRYGGLDGVLSAAEALKALIVDPSPLMRAQAARVLGAIGVKNFYQPLLDLMNDPDLSVRRAAIAAAGALQASELTTALIYGLARAETAAEAVAALAAYGPGIEATLERVLSNPLEEPSLRGAVPRVLGRLSTALAVQVITAHLADPDEAVRRSLYKALGRALRRKRGLAVDRKALLKAVDDELLRAYRALDCAEALGLPAAPAAMPREGPAAATALLGSALSEKVAQAEARLITLLGILYPESEIELLFAGLQDAVAHDATRRRAHAVELLDNVLDRPLRRRLFPLLEDLPREVKLRAAREVFPLPPADRTQRLADLLADESAWVRACTLFLCGERREGALRAPIAENLDHASPVVREATVASLEKLIAPEELARALERRPSDESAAVRARVEAALAGARGRRAQAS